MHQKSPPLTVSKPRRSTFEKSAPQTVSKRIKISPKTVYKFFCRWRDSGQTACPSEHRIAHIPRPPGVRSRKTPASAKLHHQHPGNGRWATRRPEGVASQSAPILPIPPPSRLARIPKLGLLACQLGVGCGKERDRWGCRVWSRSKLRSRYYT